MCTDALQAKVPCLKIEIHHLLEQFIRWLYKEKRIEQNEGEYWREHNEAIRKDLDKPLPSSERGGASMKGNT
jgi:hypothetical protein